MQTPKRMNNVVIKDYYHMTIIDENVNWKKLTYLLSFFALNPRGPYLYICLCFNILNSLLKRTHWRKMISLP